MRLSTLFSGTVFSALAFLGCGGGSGQTTHDLAMKSDLAVVAGDMSATAADMKAVTPYNMVGSVFCYASTACSTTSANPICCDAEGDGGFTDTCVASAAACTASDSAAHAYQCGQAADCGSGMVCCGTITTSGTSSSHLYATTCAASCGSGETQLCVTSSECTTSGTTCVGKDITGRDVGVCQ
jgi:hypothetical protein